MEIAFYVLAVVVIFAVGRWSARWGSPGSDPSPQVKNTELPQDPDARLAALLQNGRKIEAIKLYRELHGVGLKEAKGEIDRRVARLRG